MEWDANTKKKPLKDLPDTRVVDIFFPVDLSKCHNDCRSCLHGKIPRFRTYFWKMSSIQAPNQNSAFAVEDNKKLAIFAAEWLRLIAIEKENERNNKEEEIVWGSMSSLNNTTWFLGGLQVMLLILFATVAGNEIIPDSTESAAAYNMFIGVEIMMYVYYFCHLYACSDCQFQTGSLVSAT